MADAQSNGGEEDDSLSRMTREYLLPAPLDLTQVSGISIDGATLYCTHQPCVLCAKMIVNAGIVRVVYANGYPDEFSMEILNEAGISVEKMPWPPEDTPA